MDSHPENIARPAGRHYDDGPHEVRVSPDRLVAPSGYMAPGGPRDTEVAACDRTPVQVQLDRLDVMVEQLAMTVERAAVVLAGCSRHVGDDDRADRAVLAHAGSSPLVCKLADVDDRAARSIERLNLLLDHVEV